MRVSVGIPFYNAERTLADAIRSVFAQTSERWELILVDDGSSDDSLSIAQAVHDPRVTVLSDGVNRGLVSRLNQIAQLARGEYLARMDADDMMHPERLELQVQHLDEKPEVDLVSAGAYTIDADNNLTGTRGLGPLDARPELALRGPPHVHPTVTGRTSWFRLNPYDEAYVRAEDVELWCRTCAGGQSSPLGGITVPGCKLDRPLLFYRDTNQLALRPYLKSNQTHRKVIARYGPSVVGWPLTSWLMLQSHLRSAMFGLCAAAGMQGRIVSRRNAPLSEALRAEGTRALNAVLRTSVPGLGDSHPR